MKTDSPKNTFTVEPIDLIWKVHAQYEHVLKNNFSIGFGAHYYYEDFFLNEPEIKADIFCRYYRKGLYIQPAISAGENLGLKKETGGISISIGQKKVFPSSHITIDWSIGFQFYPYYLPQGGFDELGWYLYGTGAILIPRFAIGYAF